MYYYCYLWTINPFNIYTLFTRLVHFKLLHLGRKALQHTGWSRESQLTLEGKKSSSSWQHKQKQKIQQCLSLNNVEILNLAINPTSSSFPVSHFFSSKVSKPYFNLSNWTGLDEGDCRALEKQYRGQDPPCQLDPEDGRFVMKGPKFNPMVVVNILARERGYKVMYNPQQRSIPLKSGSTDDKWV